MIINYIMEDNIYVIAYRLIIQKKYEKFMLMTDSKFKIDSKNYENKIKSPFMAYADFEIILVLEDNGKQIPDEYYKKKYQKYVVCSYDYKLVCFAEKFSKPFKSYLVENAVYRFLNSIFEESKYYSGV